MPTKIRIELDHAGIQELLLSYPIAAECKAAAEQIAARAGEGFEVTERQMRTGSKMGGSRVGYGVASTTYEAMLAEAENGALSKAV